MINKCLAQCLATDKWQLQTLFLFLWKHLQGSEHFGPPLNVISQLFPAGTWDSKHYRKIVSQTRVGQGSELLSVSSLPSRWNPDTWLGLQTLLHWLEGLLQPLLPLPFPDSLPQPTWFTASPSQTMGSCQPLSLLLGRSPFPCHLVTVLVYKARPGSFFLVECPLSLPVPVHSAFS